MNITINAIVMHGHTSMTAEEFRAVTRDDGHLSMLSEYVLCGWPSMRAEVHEDFSYIGHSERML